MANIVKRQHYVWRKYLRAWCSQGTEDSIYATFKEGMRTIHTSLMNVGQQKHFYKIYELSSEELELMRRMIESAPLKLKGFASLLMIPYQSFAEIISICRSTPQVKEINPELESLIREIEINTFEQVEGLIESFGTELIECTCIDDVIKIEESGEIQKALLYFFVQFVRTKNMYSRIMAGFEDEQGRKFKTFCEHAFPFVSLFYALELCYKTVNSQWHIIFVKNETAIPFITGDQPIFNFAYNEENDEGLELYYPISPKSALVLCVDCDIPRYSTIDADEGYVITHNDAMWDNSDIQVFANNSDILQEIINTQ